MKLSRKKIILIISAIFALLLMLAFAFLPPPIEGGWIESKKQSTDTRYEVFYFKNGYVDQYYVEDSLKIRYPGYSGPVGNNIQCLPNIAKYQKIGFNKYQLQNPDGGKRIIYPGWFTMAISQSEDSSHLFIFRRELNIFKLSSIFKSVIPEGFRKINAPYGTASGPLMLKNTIKDLILRNKVKIIKDAPLLYKENTLNRGIVFYENKFKIGDWNLTYDPASHCYLAKWEKSFFNPTTTQSIEIKIEETAGGRFSVINWKIYGSLKK